MSALSNFLKMNAEELEQEINKQNKKIQSAKETIFLLKKLQIAANATSTNTNPQKQNQRNPEQRM